RTAAFLAQGAIPAYAGSIYIAGANGIHAPIAGHCPDFGIAGTDRADFHIARGAVQAEVAGTYAPDLHRSTDLLRDQIAGTHRDHLQRACAVDFDIARADLGRYQTTRVAGFRIA